MKSELLRRAFVVTPNIPEAETLSGIAIRSDADRREAARRITRSEPAAVIIKGGHLASAEIVDLSTTGIASSSSDRTGGRAQHAWHGLHVRRRAGCPARARQHARRGRRRHAALHRRRHPPGANLGRGHGPMDHFGELERSNVRIRWSRFVEPSGSPF